MERSGFFDAELVGEEYDRSYLAEQIAAYFASFIGNGVFGGKSDELQIVSMENPEMQVAALPGQAWINGYWYENTDELYLPIEVADGVLDRIDSIVVRLGFAERNMWLVVKKGVASNTPRAPELTRNADYYELQIATVHVKAGALNIKQADITDTRLNSNVCGFVVAVVNEFDTSAFSAQLDSWIKVFQEESIDRVERLVEILEAMINQGDIAPLVADIQRLKNLSIESEEHPGCYYRVVDGEVEWISPPTEPGIEYRLVERFGGRPVYQSVIHVASLPNASNVIITTNLTMSKAISIEGIMSRTANLSTTVYPFPVYLVNGAAPVAVINGFTSGLTGRTLHLSTTQDLTTYKADVIVKYVK